MSAEHLCGVYRGVVKQTNDPENRWRVRVQIPEVLGTALSNWAEPCVPLGWPVVFDNHTGGGHAQFEGSGVHEHPPHQATKAVPSREDVVWIMFVAGDVNHPVWIGTWR